MMIEAGKYYLTRSGAIAYVVGSRAAEIRVRFSGADIPVYRGYANGMPCIWLADGRYDHVFTPQEHSFDLVRELESPERRPDGVIYVEALARQRPQPGDVLKWADQIREVYAVRGDFVWLSLPKRPQGRAYRLSAMPEYKIFQPQQEQAR